MAATLDVVQDVRRLVHLAATEVLLALDAASVSVSRWEREQGQLRTLVNVGALAPGEVTEPQEEVYAVADYPFLSELLFDGRPRFTAVDDLDTDPSARALLRTLGKATGLSMPIRADGRTWGELYLTTAEGRRLSADDARWLQPLADQLGMAVVRAEHLAQMADLAFRDALTGLANRRALDETLPRYLEESQRDGRPLAVVLADLDDLKALNDAGGHDAGDAALRRAGQALAAQMASTAGLVCRTGGDEFCALLQGADAHAATSVAQGLIAELAALDPAIGVSCGVAATTDVRTADAMALLRAADAALYAAKRSGRGRACVSGSRPYAAWTRAPARARVERRRRGRRRVDVARLLDEGLGVLDGHMAGAPVLDRLVAVTDCVAAAVDAAAAAVSTHDRAERLIRTAYALDRRSGHNARADHNGIDDEPFDLDRFPFTVRLLADGGTSVLDVDDADTDPEERHLLQAFGVESVLMTAPIPDGPWLIEVYADAAGLEMLPAVNAARLLVQEAVRRADEGNRTVLPALGRSSAPEGMQLLAGLAADLRS